MAFKMKGFPFPGKSPLKVDQQLIDAATEAAMANVPDTEAQQRINTRMMSARGQGLQALGEGIGGGIERIGKDIGDALTPGEEENGNKGKSSDNNENNENNKKNKKKNNKKKNKKKK